VATSPTLWRAEFWDRQIDLRAVVPVNQAVLFAQNIVARDTAATSG
jgi:hypothetical protein